MGRNEKGEQWGKGGDGEKGGNLNPHSVGDMLVH